MFVFLDFLVIIVNLTLTSVLVSRVFMEGYVWMEVIGKFFFLCDDWFRENLLIKDYLENLEILYF